MCESIKILCLCGFSPENAVKNLQFIIKYDIIIVNMYMFLGVRRMSAEEKRTSHIFKASLIKFGAAAAALILVVLFVTFSWFTMNREAENTGMTMTATEFPFYIETSGAAPEEYQRLFNLADSEYHEGTRQGETNSYRTGEAEQIWWRLDAGDNATYSSGFRPGASGVLTFSIVPKDSNAQVVNCQFSIRAFDSTVNNQNSTTAITEITNSSGTSIQKNAKNFINGHILFFQNYSVENGHDVYSGFIGDDGLDVDVPSGGSSVLVTVYWKWINTFDQIFLKTTDTYFDYPIIADTNETDRLLLQSYIRQNSSNIFSGLSVANMTSVTNISYSSDHANSTLLNELNEGYNTADQIIGVNLKYFMLEMSASQAIRSS